MRENIISASTAFPGNAFMVLEGLHLCSALTRMHRDVFMGIPLDVVVRNIHYMTLNLCRHAGTYSNIN